MNKSKKSLETAYLLLFLLWPTGAHNFYLGRTIQGVGFIIGYLLWAITYVLLSPDNGGGFFIGQVLITPLAVVYSVLFILPMLVESLLLSGRVERYNSKMD
ncbi:MAG: NINE protein [Dehalogenimonas sp.]|uniref:TM2 domain-containing protein n=1 Tax=Candidatus Dehalogenimonas loeffleri TaxID=3127115 RepID=A0ABZ2J7D2_9CHLR|nr:NINE protein [Dehalogenimonas sp.]